MEKEEIKLEILKLAVKEESGYGIEEIESTYHKMTALIYPEDYHNKEDAK